MSLNKKKIEDVDVTGKRVLMRVDFNLPQDKKAFVDAEGCPRSADCAACKCSTTLKTASTVWPAHARC